MPPASTYPLYCFSFLPIGLTDIQTRHVRFSRIFDIRLTAANLPGPSKTLHNLVHTSTQKNSMYPMMGLKAPKPNLSAWKEK